MEVSYERKKKILVWLHLPGIGWFVCDLSLQCGRRHFCRAGRRFGGAGRGQHRRAVYHLCKSAEAYGNVEEYKSVADAFNEGMSTFDTFQDGWAADAFASGAAWGDGVADKVSGMFDFSALDSMGADSLDAFNLGNDLDSIYGNTGDIVNNTAATADALDIAEEDLAYLRDIAEREAINRFTTAEIKVEQHNENHISKDADLDGIMDAWANDFAEKLEVSEEGVHE